MKHQGSNKVVAIHLSNRLRHFTSNLKCKIHGSVENQEKSIRRKALLSGIHEHISFIFTIWYGSIVSPSQKKKQQHKNISLTQKLSYLHNWSYIYMSKLSSGASLFMSSTTATGQSKHICRMFYIYDSKCSIVVVAMLELRWDLWESPVTWMQICKSTGINSTTNNLSLCALFIWLSNF